MHVKVLLDADGAGTAFEVRAPAGTTLPSHVRHRHDGLLVVLAGAALVVEDTGTRRVDAGASAALPAGVACRIEVLSDAHLLVVARPTGLAELSWLAAATGCDPDDVAAVLSVAGVTLLPTGWRTG